MTPSHVSVCWTEVKGPQTDERTGDPEGAESSVDRWVFGPLQSGARPLLTNSVTWWIDQQVCCTVSVRVCVCVCAGREPSGTVCGCLTTSRVTLRRFLRQQFPSRWPHCRLPCQPHPPEHPGERETGPQRVPVRRWGAGDAVGSLVRSVVVVVAQN